MWRTEGKGSASVKMWRPVILLQGWETSMLKDNLSVVLAVSHLGMMDGALPFKVLTTQSSNWGKGGQPGLRTTHVILYIKHSILLWYATLCYIVNGIAVVQYHMNYKTHSTICLTRLYNSIEIRWRNLALSLGGRILALYTSQSSYSDIYFSYPKASIL